MCQGDEHKLPLPVFKSTGVFFFPSNSLQPRGSQYTIQASLGSSQIAGEQWCEQKYRGSVLHTSCHISAARTGCLMIQPTV